MSALLDRLTIDLKHSPAEDEEYTGTFTEIDCDILLDKQKIGLIQATIIDREVIPDGAFMSVMDGHSREIQWVGSCLYEPRRGRTKLVSLADYDSTEFGTMYISTLHVDNEYKLNGDSDVGARALEKFLNHPLIRGDPTKNYSNVSSAVYVLSAEEAMSKEELAESKNKDRRRRMQDFGDFTPPTDEDRRKEAEEKQRIRVLERMDANQFLRNGFFQDAALARRGNDRFLVATHAHWSKPLLSHTEASAIQFLTPSPKPLGPTGKDAEIMYAFKRMITTKAALTPAFRQEIARFIHQGGAIARSNALHIACANNEFDYVLYCMQLDPMVQHAKDESGMTALMVAAACAAGRRSRVGISETRVIDMLLSAGARKDDVDLQGMTAYGHYLTRTKEFEGMMHALCSNTLAMLGLDRDDPSVSIIYKKLMPLSGPTAVDMTGGKGDEDGFMDYSEDDREYDEMMESEEEMSVGDEAGDY